MENREQFNWKRLHGLEHNNASFGLNCLLISSEWFNLITLHCTSESKEKRKNPGVRSGENRPTQRRADAHATPHVRTHTRTRAHTQPVQRQATCRSLRALRPARRVSPVSDHMTPLRRGLPVAFGGNSASRSKCFPCCSSLRNSPSRAGATRPAPPRRCRPRSRRRRERPGHGARSQGIPAADAARARRHGAEEGRRGPQGEQGGEARTCCGCRFRCCSRYCSQR